MGRLYKFLTSKGLRSILDRRRSAFGSRTGQLEFFLSAAPARYRHHRYSHDRLSPHAQAYEPPDELCPPPVG